MSTIPPRFNDVRRIAWAGLMLAVAASAGILLVGMTLVFGDADSLLDHRLIGVIIIASAAVVIAACLAVWGIVRLFIKLEANSYRTHDVLRDMSARVEENGRALAVIADNVQLSEAARSISHRSKERTVLRLAINDEIVRGDWEAAYSLVEQLEARHGYKNEAIRLRAEVDQSRRLSQERKLHEAIDAVTAHMEAHDWDRARREMDALLVAQGNNPEVQGLPRLFARKRDEHKRRLLKAWDESVQRNEIDRGITVLKELDQYLTPNEAAALEESARGVFRARLHNLGVQFSIAVTERNWHEALRIAKQINDEFPNSRMAQEVRDRVHILNKRAAEGSDEAISVGAEAH